MVATSEIPPGEHVPTADGRVVMLDRAWSDYEALLAIRGERATPRIAFLDGAVELMSPTKDHERIKELLGSLIEAFCLDRGIDFTAVGSWTLREQAKQAGAEPDKCYAFGLDLSFDRPDLVIEVVWTSGGVRKLEIYRRLGIPEVWFWRDGKIAVFTLSDGDYAPASRSPSLPGLDLEHVASLIDLPTSQAVRRLRDALRGG